MNQTFFQSVQRHQFVQDFLQSLQPTLMIRHRAEHLIAAVHGHTVRFTDLRYFLSKFHDAFFDGILHRDRLAEEMVGLLKPNLCSFACSALACFRMGMLGSH